MRRTIGSLLVVIGSIGFGFMVLFGSWATFNDVSVEMMLFLRFAIAGVIMAAIMFARAFPWPRGRLLLALIGMGAVLYVGEAMFFFHGVRHIPGPLVSLLLYIYPVIVTAYSCLFLHERLTAARLTALLLAIGGLVLTIVPELQKTQTISRDAIPLLGVVLGVGCALTYSIYILCGGPLSKRAGAIPASTIVILSTAVVLGILTFARGDALPSQGLEWFGVIGLAVISTVVAITAILSGLERIGPVATSTLSTLEPVTTAVVGATLMHDRLTVWQFVGGAMIVLATIIIARAPAHSTAGNSTVGAGAAG